MRLIFMTVILLHFSLHPRAYSDELSDSAEIAVRVITAFTDPESNEVKVVVYGGGREYVVTQKKSGFRVGQNATYNTQTQTLKI